MSSPNFSDGEDIDQLNNQALETDFLAGLSSTFPNIATFLGFSTHIMDEEVDPHVVEENAKREQDE